MMSQSDSGSRQRQPAQTRPSPGASTPLATLDLHGRRREEAIAAVTRFLEDAARGAARDPGRGRCCWVAIVTGSGKHSGATGGPVLRTAVESLLRKRGMDYELRSGRGSFVVDALSGVSLIAAPPPTCSKVRVVDGNDEARALLRGGRRGRPPAGISRSSSLASSGDVEEDPLPGQVAADDALISRAKEESARERNRLRGDAQREESALQRALMKSEEEQYEEFERFRRDEEELQISLEESRLRHSEFGVEESFEEEALRKVLALSKTDFEERGEDEEEQLRRALDLSMDEGITKHEGGLGDEEQLQQILAQSKLEQSQRLRDDDDLEQDLQDALSRSLCDEGQLVQCDIQPDHEEEDLVERALKLSCYDK